MRKIASKEIQIFINSKHITARRRKNGKDLSLKQLTHEYNIRLFFISFLVHDICLNNQLLLNCFINKIHPQ